MDKPDGDLFRVAIIGMGKGGLALAKMFDNDPKVKVVGVSNRRQDLPGITWAKEKGIFTTSDYISILERNDIDIVVDVTGNPEVEEHLNGFKRPGVEVVKGTSAKMMWRIIEDKEAREQEIRRALADQRYLYQVGITLGSAEKSGHALKLVIRAAMELLDMPSGSAALLDEENSLMRTAAAIGSHVEISPGYTWMLRAGGLTSHILSNSEPTVIEDVAKENRFDTGPLDIQRFQSVIAVPLRAEGKIVGILYVDDYEPRKFRSREINLIGLLGTMAASSVEKVLMLERAETMAITDELTKIYNHRYFLRALSIELKRAERYKEDVTLCLIDVDHFKHFNDTYGHQKGNAILVQIAILLKQNVRETDIAARYGGEEFVIVFPKTTKKTAVGFLERLRSKVEEYPFPGRETQPDGKLTVSLGLTGYPEDGGSADDIGSIIEMADRAMYVSKTMGRNRVTVYGKDMK
jgi:diguanylate cyclase (GGDEF)-like protein